MRVLIADFDLFRTVGGGQTFYRAIIEKNPHIEFSYLTVSEAQDAVRPANARPIAYQQEYHDRHWAQNCDILPPRWCLPAFLLASNIAWSVRGQRFDVVDVPDYHSFGYFLPAALEHHTAGVARVALSMHGLISTSVSLNWASEGLRLGALIVEENMQYQCVDLRYGLSTMYLDEWRARSALPSHYFSPLRFLDPPRPARSSPGGAPDLNFIGRTEKRKGPDLFTDLVWWLPPDSYGQARIIGPPVLDLNGVSSDHHLRGLLYHRLGEKQIELCPSATCDELAAIFAGRSVTVVPSRYDTFNLVALESLFSGCPTAIGSGAGVCRFLDETFPQVPYVKVEMESPLAALPRLAEVLHDYDRHRQRLVRALAKAKPAVQGPSLADIYASPVAFDRDARREASAWYERLMKCRSRPETGRRTAHEAHQLAAACKTAATQKLLAKAPVQRRLERRQARLRSERFASRYRALSWMPEQSAGDLDRKQQVCAELIGDLRIDRSRLWRELARIEVLRGNELVAATYRLRAMRLAGEDRFGDLHGVSATLVRHGYHREAETARAMYGGHADAASRCRELIDRALWAHRQLAPVEFERVDDRRDGREYRASVIASLYNAADKLPRFLDALSLQTLLTAGQAEIVLIDSGSPGEEYRVFRRWAEGRRLPLVYARSARRETIQAAWNRGIRLARGRYLSFLGVDEAILPPTLATLADELDANPHIDWVQANSLVTNVGQSGHWIGDVMTYDRTGYSQRLASLETCYLSYVGAMYRRDLHQRLGYYDANFAAAGDTEFKNRVLPFIRSKAIPQTLGVFWNYPDGQTTRSPRAEIEDLRAWYLHRTAGGVDYLLESSGMHETENLLLAALQYRKSYCRHLSSDLEYASHVVQYLKQKWSESRAVRLSDGIDMLLSAYRNLDAISQISERGIADAEHAVRLVEGQVSEQHRLALAGFNPTYDVFRDNRHEQHNNLWPTEHTADIVLPRSATQAA